MARISVLPPPAVGLSPLLVVAGMGSTVDDDCLGSVGLSVSKPQPLDQAPQSQSHSISLSFSSPSLRLWLAARTAAPSKASSPPFSLFCSVSRSLSLHFRACQGCRGGDSCGRPLPVAAPPPPSLPLFPLLSGVGCRAGVLTDPPSRNFLP